jgi:hypothetical protein
MSSAFASSSADQKLSGSEGSFMLEYEFSDEYKGFGFSEGLERGLLVYQDGTLLAEEGMGLGACALQTGGYTYFGSVREQAAADDGRRQVVDMDRQLVWRIFGVRSRLLTRLLEIIATRHYMKKPRHQARILRLGELLSRIFRVDASFAKVLPLGRVTLDMNLNENEIVVTAGCQARKNCGKLFIMNELGGSYFRTALSNGLAIDPPTGWQTMPEKAELLCPERSLSFSMEEMHVPRGVSSTLFWGREVNSRLSWSGFECELTWKDQEFSGYQYALKFREGAT